MENGNLNSKMKGQVSWKMIFAVASVWFGAHVGGGFATGNQTRTFFVQYGFPSVFMPLIVIGIIALVYYQGIRFARNTGEYNYHRWMQKLYEPYGKYAGYLFDISYMIMTLVAVGTSIAGAASLLENLLSFPYLLGVIITGTIFFILTIFGADVVRKSSSFLTLLIFVLMAIITYVGFTAHASEFSQAVAEKQVNGSWIEVLWASLKYAGLQSLVLAAILGAAKPLETEDSVKKFAIIGFLMNGLMIMFSCWMLLSWLPVIIDETLPILTVIQALDNNVLLWAYSITLISAFITTGVNCVFGAVARYEENFTFISNITKRRMFISLVAIVISVLLSLMGLDALVIRGYGLAGILSIFVLVIPTIIVGHIKNKNFKRLEKNQ